MTPQGAETAWTVGYLGYSHGEDLPEDVAEALKDHAPPGWWQHAACTADDVDPAWWYASLHRFSRDRHLGAVALRICHRCPVATACAATALLRGEPHGIWGGLTPYRRRELRAELRGDLMRQRPTWRVAS